jgi:hypothetical protein
MFILHFVCAALLFSSFAAADGPFTLLSPDGLAATSAPQDSFGPEDHLVRLDNGDLVFIDLDGFGPDRDKIAKQFKSTDGGVTWSAGTRILGGTCINGNLLPRDAGYSVGTAPPNASGGPDRILVLGGDFSEKNVYYSDDEGVSFSCISAPEAWAPRERGWTARIPSLPGTVFMGGGITVGGPSNGLFMSVDDGASWSRPQCASVADCRNSIVDGVDTAFTMPDSPSTPGAVVADDTSIWFLPDHPVSGAFVYWLNSTNVASGWSPVAANSSGMFGRKVWLASSTPGRGCFFSTDIGAEDLYLKSTGANSSNGWSTARSPAGPWTVGSIPAPWAPRAGAVVLGLGRTAIVGAGMDLINGQWSLPIFGDVWGVDASACLLAPNGQVCSGHGSADLDSLQCACDEAYDGGDGLCATCTPNITFGPFCNLCPSTAGSFCNSVAGAGTCNSIVGCVCGLKWDGPGCTTCADGFDNPPLCDRCASDKLWGPACAACKPCSTLGGYCNGGGTQGGTGTCICRHGWTGATCGVAPPGASASASPSAAAQSGAAAQAVAPLSPASAAGLSIFLLAAGASVFVVRAYGIRGVRSGVSAGLAAAGKIFRHANFGQSERVVLLRTPSSGMTAQQAAARLGRST